MEFLAEKERQVVIQEMQLKLSDGWQIAEERAKCAELLSDESQREELKIVLKNC